MSTDNKKSQAEKDVEKAQTNNMLNAAFEEYKKRVSDSDAMKGPTGETAGMKTPFTGPEGSPDFRFMPFMSAPGMPPYPGYPGTMPPMPGIAQKQSSSSKTVESGTVPQMGNIMKLGVEVINASLLTWLKVMESLGGVRSECSSSHSYAAPSGCDSYDDHHHYRGNHGGHGSCHNISSCCEPEHSYSCNGCSCEPGVNGCS